MKKLKGLILISASALTIGCAQTSIKSGQSYSGFGAQSVDPALIEKFAPPALEPEIISAVRPYLEIQTPGGGVLSPSGKEMYFAWSVTGVPQVWKMAGPTHFPEQLTSGADATIPLTVSPDGKFLIVSRDQGGQENPGLYILPSDGGRLRKIFHQPGVRANFAWIATDSDTIYYFANDIKPDSMALYSYTVSTGERELMMSESGIWNAYDIWADRYFLLGRAKGALTAEFYKFDVSTKTLEPVLGQSENEDYEMMFWMGPSSYLVSTSKFGDFKRLYSYENGKLSPLTPEKKYDVSSFSIDHSRLHVYVQWNEGGRSRVDALAPATGEVLPFAQFPGADQVDLRRLSRFGRYAVLNRESATEPRTSYVFDWSNHSLVQWAQPSLPEIERGKLVKGQLESFPARDGVSIPMLVSRPEKCNSDPCKVIVLFHGGPESEARPGFNILDQIFTGAGFVLIQPNVRGSDGFGKAWRAADDGVKRANVITDIEDCARFVKKNWSRNGQLPKVGVMGWSYGGYSTLMAMSRFAGSYDAGVSIVGIANLRSFLRNTAPYRRKLRISEYGDPEKDAKVLDSLSPTTYIDRIKGPLMLIQGVSDPRVPVGEAVQMHDLLERRGQPSTLILLPEEGHGSLRREDRIVELGQALKFFETHL